MTSAVNKVKVGFFSFTEVTDPAAHRSYNEWHQLDHMPEQFPLPGIAFGQRWVSTPACTAGRAASASRLASVHYMTLYLMTEPIDRALAEFRALAERLHAEDRFHLARTSHLSGPFEVLSVAAAPHLPVSAEAIAYRPNRGVYVIVEEPERTNAGDVHPWTADARLPNLLEVQGVAGVWSFGATGRERITVAYIDGDVAGVSLDMRRYVESRWGPGQGPDVPGPVLAGAFETITPWQWDWFD